MTYNIEEYRNNLPSTVTFDERFEELDKEIILGYNYSIT